LSTVIYHNPRCSKSRATLALLAEHGIEPEVIAYLERPPSKADLRQVLDQLGVAPPDIIRFNEQVAKQAGLTPNDSRSEDEWLELMVANPILIERPIVVRGGQARIGRPPESVLEIL
jgi:arsenate reductase